MAEYSTDCPFAKVRDLVRGWVDDVADAAGNFDDCYESRVEEVESVSRDGFIAYTDGGFDGIAYGSLRYAHGSGWAPAAIQPYINEAEKDAEESWDADNPKHPVSWLYEREEPEFLPKPDITEREYWREKWYEHLDKSLSEGGTYFYKVRALFFNSDNSRNESGKPEVFFMVGLNTDFEYGRDHIPWLTYYGGKAQQSEWCWEKNVPVDEITPDFIATITVVAIDALRSL